MLEVDAAVRESRQDDWRSNVFKVKKVTNAIREALQGRAARTGGATLGSISSAVKEEPAGYDSETAESLEESVDRILTLVNNQNEY